MLKNALLSVVVVLVLASWAGATTMTYSVVVNTTVSPKTFDIYAYCPGSAGLGIMYFSVAATGDVSFLSGTIKAPQGSAFDDEGTLYLTGFKIRRNPGTLTSQLISEVTGAQDTGYGDVNDPFFDSLVIQNLGNSSPCLIYHGTFSGSNGTIGLSKFDGSVLQYVKSGPWTGPGNLLGTSSGGVVPLTVVAIPATVVPEPATLSLLAFGGLALIRRRK